ncbi:hypothetical protein IW492_04005 [Enterococcus sp. BWB1-3]|uniref:hypothetical protein n=1 Tax=unclassified Enterococcus TaxID=2608891 RepID=UPI001921CEFA|nr:MULTISPECIES: hypothetical protein [unclassified Enterococcus]MBL1228395.1 hypothetical protein [Enterococcus sp. BWB1-3]MCB5951211.1 hypothetical protein [Enterococcus sp. BWT-B8]MCB5954845.1 hypothetical protein [Enterococcus sp. CWB-B31]
MGKIQMKYAPEEHLKIVESYLSHKISLNGAAQSDYQTGSSCILLTKTSNQKLEGLFEGLSGKSIISMSLQTVKRLSL